MKSLLDLEDGRNRRAIQTVTRRRLDQIDEKVGGPSAHARRSERHAGEVRRHGRGASLPYHCCAHGAFEYVRMIARCEEQTRPKESERGLSHFVGNGRADCSLHKNAE
ncbi:hypothetical protein ACPA9J_03410 [Pseudomonas aeruginosa]